MKRTFVVLLVALCASLSAHAESPPNIVVLLADDLGWNAVGYRNAQFQTPHIDSLARDGMRLDHFYVAPMCSPTRAGLLTGRYPIRFGLARAVIPPYRDFGLPTEETTLAEALSDLGYEHRGVFGKWHLGHRRAKWHPLNQGFTHFHGHYNGAIDYFQLTREDTRDWHTDFQPSDEQGYSTDLIASAASRWIEDVAKDDSPYFCYVPFNAPHSPFQAPAQAIARFDALKGSGNRKRNADASIRQTYAAMIWKMDQGIGTILEAIEASGEANNTLVLFFSDNGGVGRIRKNNAPLRGSKLTVYEGGIRVPACVRWPRRIQPGSRLNVRIGYIDVMPTLVGIAGGRADQVSEKPLDGIDVRPLLVSENTPEVDDALAGRSWFAYHGQGGEQDEHLAIIDSGWKLKVNGPRLTKLEELSDDRHEVQLFHLDEDPNETTNLAKQHKEQVQRLAGPLIDHRRLQPTESVPPYRVGRQGFEPPPKWKLNPDAPNQKVGRDG